MAEFTVNPHALRPLQEPHVPREVGRRLRRRPVQDVDAQAHAPRRSPTGSAATRATTARVPGLTTYDAVTLERGVTHDPAFEAWANKVASLEQPGISLPDFRKDLIVDVFNEAGQKVISYKLFRCWVSEYQALPGLDAATAAVAIQTHQARARGLGTRHLGDRAGRADRLTRRGGDRGAAQRWPAWPPPWTTPHRTCRARRSPCFALRTGIADLSCVRRRRPGRPAGRGRRPGPAQRARAVAAAAARARPCVCASCGELDDAAACAARRRRALGRAARGAARASACANPATPICWPAGGDAEALLARLLDRGPARHWTTSAGSRARCAGRCARPCVECGDRARRSTSTS